MNTRVDRGKYPPVETRCKILGWLTGLLGAAIGAILAVPALGYVLSPLRRRGEGAAKDDFFDAGPWSDLLEGNPTWQAARNDRQLTIGILDGYGKLMSPFRDHVTRPQAQALTAYVRAFGPFKKPTSPTAPADFEERMRQLQDQWRELERQINNLNR